MPVIIVDTDLGNELFSQRLSVAVCFTDVDAHCLVNRGLMVISETKGRLQDLGYDMCSFARLNC